MAEPLAGTPSLDHQSERRRIFIVHLRVDASPSRGQLRGRVQHLASSDALHFAFVDELVGFIASHIDAPPG